MVTKKCYCKIFSNGRSETTVFSNKRPRPPALGNTCPDTPFTKNYSEFGVLDSKSPVIFEFESSDSMTVGQALSNLHVHFNFWPYCDSRRYDVPPLPITVILYTLVWLLSGYSVSSILLYPPITS